MQRVVIIDDGSGNLHSAAKAFERAAREMARRTELFTLAESLGQANADSATLKQALLAYLDQQRLSLPVEGQGHQVRRTIPRRSGNPTVYIMGEIDAYTRRIYSEILMGFIRRDYRRVAIAHLDAGWVPRSTRVDEFESATGEPPAFFHLNDSAGELGRAEEAGQLKRWHRQHPLLGEA